MKWKKWYIAFGIILFLLVVGFFNFYRTNTVNFSLPESNVSMNETISPEYMKEDIDFIVTTLREVHPKTYSGFSAEQERIIKDAYKKIEKPMKVKEFYFIANEIICSMKDAHTSMYPNTVGNRTMPLNILWLNDGMYVGNDINKLKKGDKILSIGGKDEKTILTELAKFIPAENQQWLKVMGKNYILMEMYLEHMNLINDNKVDILVERNGEELSVSLPFIYTTGALNSNNKNWISYSIDKENSLGIFTLNQCNFNDEYKTTLKNFFQEVASNNIKHVAVDVRNNTGGNSMVVNEFIKYLDVSKYTSYGGDKRYSKQAKEQRNGLFRTSGYSSGTPKKVKNEKVDDNLLFKGHVYILTSPVTFSSANWFAVIFKDNGIGTIIGEPTGNQPSSYGDILVFQTPNAQLNFSVSYKKWVRPDTSKNSEDSLYPDILVYTKIEDILNNRDPQIEALKELISK